MGQGAFGEVRKCVHWASWQVRAVKIIDKSKLDSAEKKRLFDEIDILRQMDHPNILRIFEVFQDDRRFFIVTELVTGGELFDKIISKSNFKESDAAGIIEQILGAMYYCHDRNICHWDLKPENLLVDDKDND